MAWGPCVALAFLAGCLAGPDGDAEAPASASPFAGVDFVPGGDAGTGSGCDRPLLPAGTGPVRSHEVSLATNPRDPDDVAAGFKVPIPAAREQGPNDNGLWDALARSSDGGRTWSFTTLHGYPGDPEVHAPSLPLYGAAFLSDPVLMFDGHGTLVYVGLAARAEAIDVFAASFAPGTLEPDSVVLVARGGLRSLPGAEGLPQAVDQVPTPIGVLFNDGPHVGADPDGPALFASWSMETLLDPEAAGAEGSRNTPVITRSMDGGRTWSKPVYLSPTGHLGDVAGENWGAGRPLVDADGRVHAFVRERTSQRLMDWVSEDGGESWEGPVEVAAGLDNSGGSGGYWRNTNPDPAADRSGGPFHGSIYVTWVDTRNGDRDAFVAASRDGGATWEPPVRVNQDELGNGKDQFYAFLAVEPRSGAVNVLFMDRRGDAGDETLSVAYLARSVDGGRTFEDRPLATEPTNTQLMYNEAPDGLVPVAAGYADYNSATVTADGVLAAWQDGRGATAQDRYSEIYLCLLQTPEDLP